MTYVISENLIWTNHIIESERSCRENFTRAVNTGKFSEILYKLDQYLILMGEYKNFTTLIDQLEEAEEDIAQFTALLSGGYYKAALLILRSHFEAYSSMAKAIRFNQPIKSYHHKRAAKTRHFNIKGLTDSESNLEKELFNVYEELSKNAHSSGRGHGHNSYNRQLPVPMYDEDVALYCFSILERVIDCGTAVYILCTTDTMKKQDILVSLFGKNPFGNDDPIRAEALCWLENNIRNRQILD